MDECKVSILVPTYNMQKYMRQSLYSITNQSLEDIQIICINDGSTDRSSEILEEFAKNDARIEIITKPNTGYGNSMNIGLAAAKGEYVGIVEPDDFIDRDMFKTLYELAKANDADVVKCNFYSHADNTEIKDDIFVEYLEGCTYDSVFCPRKNEAIFLTAPSTCTALYKSSLIKDNDVRYLETPGASFQDTFFNYQILALAERMYLTKEAFHHYRINEGSSVLSPGKIFCVCDEYDAIWEHAKGHPDTYDDLKYRIPRAQYGTYYWNLQRLSPKVRHQFYERFVDDFGALDREGLLNEEYFDEFTWSQLNEMLANPDEFFVENYGSPNVESSIVVMLSRDALGSVEDIAAAIRDLIPSESEVYFQLDRTNSEQNLVSPDALKTDPRFYQLDNVTSSSLINRIFIDELRGSILTVIHANGRLATKKDIESFKTAFRTVQESDCPFVSDRFAMGTWDKNQLANLELPIWEPLLFANFYAHCLPERPNDIPEWLLDAKGTCGESVLQTVKDTNGSFVELHRYLLEKVPESDYAKRKEYFPLFARLWKLVQAEYNALSYEGRLQFGEVPSPLQCSGLTYINRISSQQDRADVSVIIPVYNVEAYLSDCLDSVLSQEVESLQIICINDASTDGSLEILEGYANDHDNITVISQFNGGAGAARNRGIELSNSEYLAFIDPDDYYSSAASLRCLFDKATSNNAKICGGSVELFRPDGSIETFSGGEQFFYRMSHEGMQRFTDKETDYGWIRFIYHESIFSDGGVRFPERRWYEDPVFLTRVIDYCDEYYAVPQVVYEYRVDHKEVTWDVVKVRDMLKGICGNMDFAKRHSLPTLYTTLVYRINRDYYPGIMEYITDEEIFTHLATIQGTLDLTLLNDVLEKGWKSYLIKPLFDFINRKDTAIVRLAKRAQDTSAYRFLQKIRARSRQ